MSNSADHQTHPSGSEEWREKYERLVDEWHGAKQNDREMCCCDEPDFVCSWSRAERNARAALDAHVLSAPAATAWRDVNLLRAIYHEARIEWDAVPSPARPSFAVFLLNRICAISGCDSQLSAPVVQTDLLQAIRERCRVIYFPPHPAYPIEHTMAAGKDQWSVLAAALGSPVQDGAHHES